MRDILKIETYIISSIHRDQLLKYCYKDTYAMVGLLYKLYEDVGITDYLNLDQTRIIESC